MRKIIFFFCTSNSKDSSMFMQKKMRKLYHVCLSSGSEVMFRSQSDYIRGFNCLAVALHKTSSSLFADSFMSNHFHICVESNDVRGLMFSYRAAYSRYFNNKYYRKVSLLILWNRQRQFRIRFRRR